MPPTNVQKARELFAQGQSAFGTADWFRAISLFNQATTTVGVLPAYSKVRRGYQGWAELARAMERRNAGVGGRNEAQERIEAARKLFLDADQTGLLFATAMQANVGAEIAGEEGRFDEAIELKQRAAAAFRKLSESSPGSTPFRRSAARAEVDALSFSLMQHVSRESIEAAQGELAEFERAISEGERTELYTEADIGSLRRTAKMAKGFLALAMERHAWRTLDAEGARAHALRARVSFEEMGSPSEANSGRLATLANVAVATAEAYAGLLAGDLVVANAAIQRAAVDVRTLTSPRFGKYLERFERLSRVQERRAQVDALADLIAGRSHDLFACTASAPIPLSGSLGDQVRRDLSELQAAYSGQAWRLTIIAAGALLEGVLLHRLREDYAAKGEPSNETEALAKLGLAELLDRAAKRQLVSHSGRLLTDALREHRNLVHPGKEERARYRVDRATADSSLRITLTVLSDLWPQAIPAAG